MSKVTLHFKDEGGSDRSLRFQSYRAALNHMLPDDWTYVGLSVEALPGVEIIDGVQRKGRFLHE